MKVRICAGGAGSRAVRRTIRPIGPAASVFCCQPQPHRAFPLDPIRTTRYDPRPRSDFGGSLDTFPLSWMRVLRARERWLDHAHARRDPLRGVRRLP